MQQSALSDRFRKATRVLFVLAAGGKLSSGYPVIRTSSRMMNPRS